VSPMLFLVAALAATPVLNIERACKGQAFADKLTHDFDGCVRDEKAAQATLNDRWTTYPAKIRNDCARAIRAAPEGTYVELLTCIEIQTSNSGLDLAPKK
jgi:hypothetical protein